MTAPLNLNSYRDDNLGALEISITEDQRARLDKVSATSLGFPHDLLRVPTIARSMVAVRSCPRARGDPRI